MSEVDPVLPLISKTLPARAPDWALTAVKLLPSLTRVMSLSASSLSDAPLTASVWVRLPPLAASVIGAPFDAIPAMPSTSPMFRFPPLLKKKPEPAASLARPLRDCTVLASPRLTEPASTLSWLTLRAAPAFCEMVALPPWIRLSAGELVSVMGVGCPTGLSIVIPPVKTPPPTTMTPATTLFSSASVRLSLPVSSNPPSEMARFVVTGVNMVRATPESMRPSR